MSDTAAPSSPATSAGGIEIVAGLGSIAERYDLILSDVWGVLHNGVTAFPEAGDALSRFRAGGGRVVLVSNAPRPGGAVADQLAAFGVPADSFDAVVTSGDVTRSLILAQEATTLYHLGPERDAGLFHGLPTALGSADTADLVVCTGLVDDETETVADYAELLARFRQRGLLMICANPDIVVERGHLLIPCAGALAAAYEAIGGATLTGGKPFRPIYDAAIAVGERALGRTCDRSRILAVGDAIRTDVAGARDYGLDVVMVARGIHAAEFGYRAGAFDPDAAMKWLAAQDWQPTALAPQLGWA